MTEAVAQRKLFDFTRKLLENTGGLVDWTAPDATGTAVVSDDVATLLHAPGEAFELSSQTEDDALSINLATDFLDNASHILHAKVPSIGSFRIPDRYLKGGDLQAVIERTYTWLNARVRLGDISPSRTEYHTWWFSLSLRSDDCWESCLAVSLNSKSLAEVDLDNPLCLPDLEPASDIDGPGMDGLGDDGSGDDVLLPVTHAPATVIVRRRMLEEAAVFLDRMDGHLARDQQRLRDYYGALRRETVHRPRRGHKSSEPEEIESRQRAVKLELRRKLAELQQQYAMEARVLPIVLLRTSIPTLAVEMNVRRKQADRTHTIYWNSLTKQFEPLRCEVCGHGSFSIGFTKGDVRPLCAACYNGNQQPPSEQVG